MNTHIAEHLQQTLSDGWTWWWDVGNKRDEIARTVLTVFLLVLPFIWWQYTQTSVKQRRDKTAALPLPPGPHGLPIVGYLPFLSTNLHRQFLELAHCYGPIFKLRLGARLCIVLSSPLLAKEVVRDQDTTFANRDPPVAALAATYGGLDIAWSPSGPYWRSMRKVFVREMMSNNVLEACSELRRLEVWKSIRKVYAKIGTPVQIGAIAFLTEFNVIVNMMWGGNDGGEERTDVTDDEFRDLTVKLIDTIGKANISDFFPMLVKFDIQGVEREVKRLLKKLDVFLDSIINERKSGVLKPKEEKRMDMLQILLEAKQEDTGSSMTDSHIKAILMDLLSGATDTTATTIEWAMTEIMNHREIKKKVQQELTDVVGMENVVEEAHIPKLQYLGAVVKETFRLHPPVPLLLPKCPSKTSQVGGYTVPKGTKIFLNVWAMQRDPSIWENPSEFKPERFWGDSGTATLEYSGHHFQYLPFGSGRRICPGIPLAEIMVTYVLASLLHLFEWHLPEDEKLDLSEKFGIVLRKRVPLIIVPTPRLSKLDLYA